MFKKPRTIPVFIIATILLGAISACNSSNSTDESSGDNSQAKVSENTGSTPNNSHADTPERAQKREAIRKQVEAILTPDQVKQLTTKLQSGEKMRKAVFSLNLTPEQKTKIQELFKSAYPSRQGEKPKNLP